jgi:hypothetical protein
MVVVEVGQALDGVELAEDVLEIVGPADVGQDDGGTGPGAAELDDLALVERVGQAECAGDVEHDDELKVVGDLHDAGGEHLVDLDEVGVGLADVVEIGFQADEFGLQDVAADGGGVLMGIDEAEGEEAPVVAARGDVAVVDGQVVVDVRQAEADGGGLAAGVDVGKVAA